MIKLNYILCLIFTIGFCKKSLQNPLDSPAMEVDESCECGEFNDISSRIIGGRNAEPNQFPWMVAIFNKEEFHCGGSLINNKYIITAGHCLKWAKKKDLSVYLGLHDKVMVEEKNYGGLNAEIESIKIHENFTTRSFYDAEDIGLIKLKKAVTYTPEIKPVCLPQLGSNYSGEFADVMGWGRTEEIGQTSRYLKHGSVTVMSNKVCRELKVIGKDIIDSMLCAYENEMDACQGDSGGPLIYSPKPGRGEIIGIVSWGLGCAQTQVPGVYTRVTSYLDWIAENTNDAHYCSNPV